MDNSRIGVLDGLRGLAAFFVVVYHMVYRYNELYGHNGLNVAAFRPFEYGYLGVQLFFMISGFVIFMSLEKKTDWRSFAIGRISRLFPAYIISVIITYLIVSYAGLPGREVDIATMLVNLTMLNGFVNIPYVDGVYWTLKVELTFYVLIGVLFYSLKRNIMLHSLILLIALGTAFRFGFEDSELYLAKVVYYSISIKYLHYFAAGIGFYFLFKGYKTRVSLVLIALSLLNIISFSEGNELILLLSFFGLFSLAFVGKGQRTFFLNNKLFIFLGKISFPAYLLHQNIGYIFIRKGYDLNWDPLLVILISLVVILLLSTAVHNLVEIRFGRYFKNKLSRFEKS